MAASSYPKMPAIAWRTLRAKAAAAPSTKFTPEVVAALMGMSSPESAQRNTVSHMRRLGLIDEDGSLTARGIKWRNDSSFGDACQEILDEVYPNDLDALLGNDGSPDTMKVTTWFGHQGFGESNARQMAATYVMVASKQIPEPPTTDSGDAKTEGQPTKKPTKKPPKPKMTNSPQEGAEQEPPSPTVRTDNGPTIHLDIQIHIPADATPEKIDHIFSSMARHLYSK